MKAWIGLLAIAGPLYFWGPTASAWTTTGEVIRVYMASESATTYWGYATLKRTDSTYAMVYFNKSDLGGYSPMTEAQLGRVLPLFCQGATVTLYAVGYQSGVMDYYYYHPGAAMKVELP
ncbi:MAG: hypothetical protein HYY17_12025 [Planctomycetes bacterium]|nr:hypothetical protein [Planctomycetota bacterium]